MKEHRFLTYEQQVALLRSQGLIISDEKKAIQTLSNIGYYELINGYKRIFKKSGNGSYFQGTAFEDIHAMYQFDENLRQLFLKYILRVEIHIRSLLSYAFCRRYSEQQSAYLDPQCFDASMLGHGEVNRLIGELDYAANRSDKAAYVCHHRSKYGNVPLWVVFKTLSLGTLIRFFRCSTLDIRTEVTDAFYDLREQTLGRMLDLIQDFRNVCAHNDCLYTYTGPDSIPPMPILSKVPAENGEYFDFKGNDLFAVVISMFYLLDESDFTRLVDSIERIIAHLEAGCGSLSRERLLRAMGFPSNWDELAKIQKNR